MTKQAVALSSAGLGHIPPRAMGLPIVIDNLGFGASASVYADVIDLRATYGDRIFTGIIIQNPDSSNALKIAMGAVGGSNKVITVPKNGSFAADNLTFGPGIVDAYTNTKCSVIRALLGATAGTAGSATINYSVGPIQPTDGMCVFINGKVYEFLSNRNDGSNPSYIGVQIGTTADLSWTALQVALVANEQACATTINTGTHIITMTSSYASIANGTSFLCADGDAAVAHTTGAVFNHANLATGAVDGTIPIFNIW